MCIGSVHRVASRHSANQCTTAGTALTIGAMSQITYGRIKIEIDGDDAVITFSGASGPITIRVPAAQLERWAMRILRAEALT